MPHSAPSPDASWTRGLAGVPGGALAFAGLCVLGVLAIACGALFEVGRVRREAASASANASVGSTANAIIGRAQFGWRLASAAVWCVALGLMAYASSWGWPRQALSLGLDGRGWLRLLAWAMLLVLAGLALLAQDLWRVRARSAIQEEAFRAGLSRVAQQEIERARKSQAEKSKLQKLPQDAPSDGEDPP